MTVSELTTADPIPQTAKLRILDRASVRGEDGAVGCRGPRPDSFGAGTARPRPKRPTAYAGPLTRGLIAFVATSVHDQDRRRTASRRAVPPRSANGMQSGHLPPRACMPSTPRTNAPRSSGTVAASSDAERVEVSVCRLIVRSLAGIAFGVGPWAATVSIRLCLGEHTVRATRRGCPLAANRGYTVAAWSCSVANRAMGVR